MIAKKLKKGIEFGMLFFLLIFIAGCGSKTEEYRQIQVYKTEGTVSIERQGSSMEAYESMQLQSGDSIETAEDSLVQLKLDDDKYILVEAASKISLHASGNKVDSKTSIYLEKGAIVNSLENSLSEKSSYDVTTPNSTMAVRGTTFRVALSVDEKGETHASVAVYGGNVECKLVFPDGTEGEVVMAETGTEVLIFGNDEISEFVGINNVNYEELKLEVIEFLEAVLEKGEKLSITKEEIQILKESAKAVKNKEITTKSEEKEIDEEIEDKKGEETDIQQVQNIVVNNMEDVLAENEESNTVTDEITTENNENLANGEEQENSGNSEGGSSTDNGGNSGGTGGSGNGGNSGGTGGSGNGDNSQGGETSEVTERCINIIFYCNGAVYAATEQIVDSTSTFVTVSKPSLQPFATTTGWEINESADFWIEEYDEKDENYPIVFKESSTETISFKAGIDPLTISFKCDIAE